MAVENSDLNKLRYTHRDYESIKNDLINAIPSLTQEWTSRENSDPGIVLIKLMAMFGDTLSFNMDKIALEMYLSTVTQRKNCAMILRLLGYKMHWYQSARTLAKVRLLYDGTPTNPNNVVIKPFITTFQGGSTIYTVVPKEGNIGASIDINSSTHLTEIYLIEGKVVTLSFNRNSLRNNRYYFSESAIDESHIWLNFGGYHNCKLVENLYLVVDDTAVSFEFNIDEYGQAYIELVSNWEDIVGSSAASDSFVVRYIVSKGESGSISSNQLSQATNVGEGSTGTNELFISHPGNNSPEITNDGWTAQGHNPQTVEDARKDAAKYVTTYDTLVSPVDFERAALRVDGITASCIVDNQILINNNLAPLATSEESAINKILQRGGKDDFPSQIIVQNGKYRKLLAAYCAVLYAGYLNFGAASDLSTNTFDIYNQYSKESPTGDYEFKNYDQFIGLENNSTTIPVGIRDMKSFPYKPEDWIFDRITQNYENCKSVNVDIKSGTTKVFPFKVSGILHLYDQLSPGETLSIISDIDHALSEYYLASNHKYGEVPRYTDVMSVVKNANSKINFFEINQGDESTDYTAYTIIEYNPPCHLSKFDITSFAVYTGLGSHFNLYSTFLRFKIRNNDSAPCTLSHLNSAQTGTSYTINPGVTATIYTDNITSLKALIEDMTENPQLVYVPWFI